MMKKPKIIGIIGGMSEMAIHIVIPLFTVAGYEVIWSDPRNPDGLSNQQVIERADVVYFSIMPIDAVAGVIQQLIQFARPSTLWLHGTSIQNPVDHSIAEALSDPRLREGGVTVGFLHFMVGPKVRSLRGQSIFYGLLDSPEFAEWESWLVEELRKVKPRLTKMTPEAHDEKTAITQVDSMMASFLLTQLWRGHDAPMAETLRLAGPPGQLQAFGAIRHLSQPGVLAGILVNHPATRGLIRRAIVALRLLDQACANHDDAALAELAQQGLTGFSADDLQEISRMADWQTRLLGDMRGGAIGLAFSAEENRDRLLADVVAAFEGRGFTSCMTQEVPGGGCVFYLGFKDIDDPQLSVICNQVLENFGGRLLAVPN